MQVSLALHNENLSEAIGAHAEFVRRNFGRFGWFLLICAMHFFFIMACDAIARGAIADRALSRSSFGNAFSFARAA